MTPHIDDHNTNPGGDTTSLWMGISAVPPFDPLTADIQVDVCIVGAGIAGLSTAYMLCREGKRVAVLDDGPIAGGESGRTTAHLTAVMDDRIEVLAQVHGEEGARRIVESHLAAVNRIEEIVKLENIDCDFLRVPGYLFLGGDDTEDDLDRELAAARAAGLADARKVERAPIGDCNTGPALEFQRQAQFQPLKYMSALASAIVARGSHVFSGTHVSSVNGGTPCTVETDGGKIITASAVCVCTNASISDMVQTHAQQAPYRTYAIAAAIPRGSVLPGLYWDTADPYHYVRIQQIDAPHPAALKGDTLIDALIVGGEDHKTGHPTKQDERWQCLERWMRERFPAARDVMYRWSGQVLEPNDYIAFIGRNPDGAENVYMASGDSGQGMTHGTIAGILLTDLVVGRSNPWEHLYDPRRVTLRARTVEALARENADVALHYIKDYLSPGDVPSESEIPRGEGRVVRHGMRKVAAYRDDRGTLHMHSAVCTHLKCVVDWNSAEKTWDCPCHGSRFDPYGRVLNGPAVSDLEAPAPNTAPRSSRRSRSRK